MKILVTGGAGYIGSHTVKEILDKKWEVIVADNFSKSTSGNLETLFGRMNDERIVYCDLRHKKHIKEIFAKHKFDAVIHFAAYKDVGESVLEPLSYYENNTLSLINVLEAVKKYKVPYFVFSSSCSVYGEADTLPITEETLLKKAESPYGMTKQMCEQIIIDTYRNMEGNAVLLRYFNPAGAHPDNIIGESPIGGANSLVSRIVSYAKGDLKEFSVYGNDYDTRDGSCVRDFIHVSDLANAHVTVLENIKSQEKAIEIYNVATGKGTTVLEMINAFKEECKDIHVSIGPRRDGDIISAYSDNTKIEKQLNWKPKYTIKDIVKTAWAWANKK
jgi:UDP-glucose 4-epimerase